MKVLDAFRLDGQVALITGGARGLGRDMAEALGEAGASLVVTSRQAADAEAAARALAQALGVPTLGLALDVREPGQVRQAVTAAHAWKGRLDVLVNNAGGSAGGGSSDFLERRPEDMTDLIATNLLGSLFCAQAAARFMAGQGGGRIVNIASIAGLVGRDRSLYARTGLKQQAVDYAAAKAGVIGMTLDLAAALGPKNIRVNAISPGGFERGQPPAFIREYSARTALGRMGRDGVDLKGAVLYLASAASDYVTGHNLVVDGGFTPWH
jgi:NAD(P)-dependent dehydrogenase (short-subunit alcohol dehydrogenase family)